MKATIDIPDDLYRRVKAKTAMNGRAIRDVTIELFRNWINEPESYLDAGKGEDSNWVDQLLKHKIPADTPGETVREILEQDRNRLHPTQ